MRLTSSLALSTALSFGLVAPAAAQDASTARDAAPEQVRAEGRADSATPEIDDFHNRASENRNVIVVSGASLKQFDLLAGVSVLEADAIQQNLAGQLGDVLLKIPGVSATSFSPGSSRPILRGFSGERVRVLTDGLGTIDVSNTSVDHANTIDPLTAERIEVLRGPAVMLYGSQAIGGAVNVIDKRIPRRLTGEPFHLDAIASVNSAYSQVEAGASLDVPVTENLMVHASGTWRDTDDVRIAGYALSPMLRADILADAAEEEDEGHPDEAAELREAADQSGRLPNSSTRTWTANAGFAIFAGDSTLGAAIGWYDTAYGIPTRPGAGHAHGGEEGGEGEAEEEGEVPVSIGLKQFRADLRADIALGEGFFDRFVTRIGYSDYTHTEFEGDEVGTTFDVKGMEVRSELHQADRDDWNGSIGMQYYFRDFFAEGAEAYVPPNTTEQFALFGLQEFGGGPFQIELAGRFERSDIEAQTLGIERSFNTYSAASGFIYDNGGALRTGINLSRAQRAPSAEELLSAGPHIATQAFEIGDPGLGIETALGAEAFLRGKIGEAEVSLSVFKSWFDDYVYLAETGIEEDGLPVFQYLQDDADYFGIEGEVNFPLYRSGDFTLLADLRGDYIRATLDDGTPIPRIPPLSLLGALEAQSGRFDARAEVQWSAKQDRIAGFETPTDSFTFVNASLSWKPLRQSDAVTLLVGADNIFDVTGRRHASFTKDFAPLAGRNFKASVRFSF